jgi:hypothetical protein
MDAHETLRLRENKAKNREIRARNRRLQEERYRDALSQQTATIAESVVRDDEQSGGVNFGMAVARDACELAYTVNALTCGKGLEYQKAVLDKLLEQPLLQQVLPAVVVQREEIEQCRLICSGIADAWSKLKFGLGRDRYLARNVIEAAVIDVKDKRSAQAAAHRIGMNKRTLRRAISRRISLNAGEVGAIWAKGDRKRQKDALSQSTIDTVIAWWTDQTRVSPQKKDVRRKRIRVKRFISHAGHWLEESQV